MKLSASNIAWSESDDLEIFTHLNNLGFSGIEIAPTRIIKEKPYAVENRTAAIQYAKKLCEEWSLEISSMQSILYGINERIFASTEERDYLIKYMHSAIEFAADIECPHLVFGCPRNRNIDNKSQEPAGIDFFSNCADHAKKNGVTIGLEANPSVYGTNYLNTTNEVIQAIKLINSPALKLNYDMGANLINDENIGDIFEVADMISHVHISEPLLAPIQIRDDHTELANKLRAANYSNWISLEMKNAGVDALVDSLHIVSKSFRK